MKVTKFFGRCLASTALFATLAIAGSASAALIIDVQATGVTGSAVLVDGKSIINAAVGDTVSLSIFANISSAGANGFQSGAGRLASNAANALGTKGTMTHVLNPTFTAAGSFAGTAQDIDADGDIDIGALSLANDAVGQINYRSASSTAGSSILIGTGVFTVTEAGLEAALLNFQLGTTTGFNLNPLWTENGVQRNAASGQASAGLPVSIATGVIPEPSTLAFAGVALAGFAGFQVRRRRVAK